MTGLEHVLYNDTLGFSDYTRGKLLKQYLASDLNPQKHRDSELGGHTKLNLDIVAYALSCERSFVLKPLIINCMHCKYMLDR